MRNNFKIGWTVCVTIICVLALFLFLIKNLQTSYNPQEEEVVGLKEKINLEKPTWTKYGGPLLSIQEFMKESEKIWKKSVDKRHKLVGSKKDLEKLSGWSIGLVLWWDYFYPAYNCPRHMERIGRAGDGGKWVCGFSVFESSDSPCIIYSFGVAWESTFEAEIIERSRNCQIWAYDPTVNGMQNSLQKNKRVHFKKLGIGSVDDDKFHKLDTLMKQNGHDWIDILKMDVEGSEFRTFRQILDQFDDDLPFGQLQIELHVGGQKFQDFYQLWEELEAKGLRAIHMEPNDYGYRKNSKPTMMEYAFLNVKRRHRVIE